MELDRLMEGWKFQCGSEATKHSDEERVNWVNLKLYPVECRDAEWEGPEGRSCLWDPWQSLPKCFPWDTNWVGSGEAIGGNCGLGREWFIFLRRKGRLRQDNHTSCVPWTKVGRESFYDAHVKFAKSQTSRALREDCTLSLFIFLDQEVCAQGEGSL